MRKMFVGVTGKTNSGKNFVSEILKKYGFTVWDLDLKAKEIRNAESAKVLKLFGTTDPKQIGKIVFSDPEKLKALEDIIYPKLVKDVKTHKSINTVLNGALLYRSGLDKLCDFIIYVDSPLNDRLSRGIKRDNISRKDFILRDKMQYDVSYKDVKYRCPVFVIKNKSNTTATELEDKIRVIINSALSV